MSLSGNRPRKGAVSPLALFITTTATIAVAIIITVIIAITIIIAIVIVVGIVIVVRIVIAIVAVIVIAITIAVAIIITIAISIIIAIAIIIVSVIAIAIAILVFPQVGNVDFFTTTHDGRMGRVRPGLQGWPATEVAAPCSPHSVISTAAERSEPLWKPA